MSTYFSKVIKAGERQREFNFRQVNNGQEPVYNVDVPDEKGNRVVFNMQKDAEGRWKTAMATLPLWVHDAEAALADAIEENRINDLASRKK